MIQHHLVFHFSSIDDGHTYYEANPEAAYYLVRSGKILQLVEERLGEYAAKMMETIMFLGHASIRHLESMPELKTIGGDPVAQPAAMPNGVSHDDENEMDAEGAEEGMEEGAEGAEEEVDAEMNGHEELPEAKPAPFNSTLKALASHGYILRVREAFFQSPSDNYLDAKRIISVRSDVKALKGKRQEEAIDVKTKELLDERTDYDLSAKYMYNGLPRGVKRKWTNGGSAPNHSQAETNGNGVNGDHADEEENDWSEDEDGFDNIPMEVSFSRISPFT